MSKVSRSEYQKVCEENKRLTKDMKLLVSDGISTETILCKIRWRKRFRDEELFNAALESLKEDNKN